MGNEHDACIICGSTGLMNMAGYQHAHLSRCGQCNLVFSRRIPEQDELLKNYSVYPREQGASPITIKRYRQLLDEFERYKVTNNILDIGCGSGYFLHTAKEKGWKVHGTEFDDDAVAVCHKKGIDVRKSKTSTAEFEDGSFDVITLFEVIEHLNYPLEEIATIKRLLRKGGIVYVTTPNFDSMSRRFLNAKWNNIVYPDHLTYYSRETLNDLFSRHGLQNIDFKTTGFSFSRLRSSIKPDGGSDGSRTDEQIRGRIESSYVLSAVKSAVNGMLSFTDLGDTLKATYRK